MSAALSSTTRRGVLVHCWAGVNRSAAVAAYFLTTECRVPLVAAVAQLMQRRGTALTNRSFRKQLVRYCFRTGLALTGSDIPAALLAQASVLGDDATEDHCLDGTGGRAAPA